MASPNFGVRVLRKVLRSPLAWIGALIDERTDGPGTWRAMAQAGSCIHPTTGFVGPIKSPGKQMIVGSGCQFERGVSIWLSADAGAEPQITLGKRVFVGQNTYLGSYKPISIGDSTLIGANCYIISGNHRADRRDIPIQEQGFVGEQISIGKDVWLGAGVTVLPGVTIGDGAIVGAGAVVTKSIPSHEIWAGIPARFLKTRPG